MALDARDLVLVIADKPDIERDAVAAAWQAAGGEVLRLGRFWDPPALDAARVRIYGAEAFAQVLAQRLGLALLSPADDHALALALEEEQGGGGLGLLARRCEAVAEVDGGAGDELAPSTQITAPRLLAVAADPP